MVQIIKNNQNSQGYLNKLLQMEEIEESSF